MILEEFQNRRYNFASTAKKFKLIEENTKPIFISREKEVREWLQWSQVI